MSTYICRLMDNDGAVRGVVPIIGSTEADAILIARNHFQSSVGAANFELWKGKVRILAQGAQLPTEGETEVEAEAKAEPLPRITSIAAPSY